MSGSPKNVVHLSNADVTAGRTKHVTLAEIAALQSILGSGTSDITLSEVKFSSGAGLKTSEDGNSLIFVDSNGNEHTILAFT